MEELLTTIIAAIFYVLAVLIAVIGIIYLAITDIKTHHLRNDYIKTLNEHDKSVIMSYKAIQFKLFKRKGK